MSWHTTFVMVSLFAYINIYNSRPMHVCASASSHRFRDINVSQFYLQKIGQGHGVSTIFVMLSFDGKYQNLETPSNSFCDSSHSF